MTVKFITSLPSKTYNLFDIDTIMFFAKGKILLLKFEW